MLNAAFAESDILASFLNVLQYCYIKFHTSNQITSIKFQNTQCRVCSKHLDTDEHFSINARTCGLQEFLLASDCGKR